MIRKIGTIFLMFTLVVSIYDVIDTSDIMLGNETAFSSNYDNNQNQVDDLDIDFLLSIMLVYHIVELQTNVDNVDNSKIFFTKLTLPIPKDYISKIKEPPIA